MPIFLNTLHPLTSFARFSVDPYNHSRFIPNTSWRSATNLSEINFPKYPFMPVTLIFKLVMFKYFTI